MADLCYPEATPQRQLANKTAAEAETQPASEEELLRMGLGGSDHGSVKGGNKPEAAPSSPTSSLPSSASQMAKDDEAL